MQRISNTLLWLRRQLNGTREIIFSLFMLVNINAIAAVISYALTISLANILGPRDFGTYSFVLILGSILSIFIAFGTDQTAPMHFSKMANREKVFSIIFGTRLFIIFMIALVIGVYSIAGGENSYYILCLLAVAFNLSYLYEATSKNIRYSYIYLTERLIYVSLVFMGIFCDKLNITLVFSLFLISALISVLYQYWDMRLDVRNISRCRFGEYLSIIQSNYPLVIIGLALFCYGGFSRIILENKLGTTTLGIYSAGWQLISIGTLFQSQVTRVWRLKISMAVVHTESQVLTSLTKSYIVLTTVPLLTIVTIMFVAPNQIVLFLFSSSYNQLAEVVPIFGVYFIVINLAGLAEMLWVPIGKNKSYMVISVLFGAILLLILYFMPPEFGLVGFAVSTVTIHFAATIFLLGSWFIVYRDFAIIKFTKNG